MLISLISQLLGFLREVLVANYYGASLISDAYIVAIISPTIIMGLIASGLTAVFIPKYSNITASFCGVEARKYTENLILYAFILGVFIATGSFYFSESLIKGFALGFNDDAVIFTKQFFEITIISMPFILVNTILLGFLQVHNQHTYTAMIIIPSNFVGVLFVYYSYYLQNTLLLVFGYLFSVLIQFCFLLFQAKKYNLFNKINFFFPDKNIKDTLYLALPVILGVSLNQINFIIDRTMASTLGGGSISVVNYATRISTIVEVVVITSLVSIFYPKMSNAYSNGNKDKFNGLCNELLIVILLLSIPLVCCFFVYSNEVVNLLFGRGEFDSKAVSNTASLLEIYALAIPLIGFRTVLCKAFYSLGDTKTPIFITSFSVVINIILNVILIDYFGLDGLASASVISAFISVSMLFYFGHQKNVFNLNLVLFIKLLLLLVFYFLLAAFIVRNFLPISFQWDFIIKINFLFELTLIILLTLVLFMVGSAKWFSKSTCFIKDAVLINKFK